MTLRNKGIDTYLKHFYGLYESAPWRSGAARCGVL